MSENSVKHQTPIRVANISDGQKPGWVWLLNRPQFDGRIEAKGFTTNTGASLIGRLPGAASLKRRATILRFAKIAGKAPFDLVISHGPVSTFWTARVLNRSGRKRARRARYHLAYSFNFTDLPTGPRKAFYKKAFQQVDKFVVYTRAEEKLYARYFGIPRQKILRAPWGVSSPLKAPTPRQIDGPYVAALGGEARDYETLCRAAALCPQTQFVCIARPWNFSALEPPANMRVVFNLPGPEAWGLLSNAALSVVPLRGRETPCGLVTVVGAMHLGKAQIVTNAAGVSDYISHGETGIMVPPGSPWAIANAVNRLLGQPDFAAILGRNAQHFAQTHCSEEATIAFVDAYIKKQFPAQ